MATCKDCVHYDVCNRVEKQIVFTDSSFEEVINSLIKCCRHFLNKADFVEVKHGEWVRQKGRPEAICSECGREVVYQVIDNRWRFENFCPHCGADMRKEGADNG